MISAACRLLFSMCSSPKSSTGSSTGSSSSAGQANSSPWRCVNRSRISLAQDGMRDLTKVFHEQTHQLFRRKKRHDEHFQRSKQHAEVDGDHRIVGPMLQTPAEKICRQKHCDRSATVFEVAPDYACTNPFVLSRRYPALHAEISESQSQMHIQQ